MHLDEIDGELHILDENLNIIHVFERARSSDANGEVTLSRAAYKHLSKFDYSQIRFGFVKDTSRPTQISNTHLRLGQVASTRFLLS